jgi:AraC family transcriptional regulator, glycine betaine-responsive activator
MPIMSITVACGFRSPAHFSKSYRAVFGHSPSRQRRDPAPSPAKPKSGRASRPATRH